MYTKSTYYDLICHRVSTSQKSYRLSEREKTSVAASKQLAQPLQNSTEIMPSTGRPSFTCTDGTSGYITDAPTTINTGKLASWITWNEEQLFAK